MGGGQKKVIRGKPPCVHRRRTTATSGTSFPRYQDVKPGGLPLKIKRRNSANLQTNLADAIGQLSLYKPKSHRANRPFPASGLSAPPQRFRNNWNRRRNTKAKTTTEGVDKDSELVPDLSDDEVNTKGINAVEAFLSLSLVREVQKALKEDAGEQRPPASPTASPQCPRGDCKLKDAPDEKDHLITPGSPIPEVPIGSPITPLWMQEDYKMPGAPASPQYAPEARKLMGAVGEDHTMPRSPASPDSGLWMRRLPAKIGKRNLTANTPPPPASSIMRSSKRLSNASHYPATVMPVASQKVSPPSTSSTPEWLRHFYTADEEASV